MHALEPQEAGKTTKVLEKYNKHHTVLLQPGEQANDGRTVLETKQKRLVLEVDPTNTDQSTTQLAQGHETKTAEEHQSNMAEQHQFVNSSEEGKKGKVLEIKHKEMTLESSGEEPSKLTDISNKLSPEHDFNQEGSHEETAGVFGLDTEEENVANDDQPEKNQQFPSLFDEDVEEVVLERKTKRFTCVIYPNTQLPIVDVHPSVTNGIVESTSPVTDTGNSMEESPALVDKDSEKLDVLGNQQDWEVLETKTKELILEVPGAKIATSEQESKGDSPTVDSVGPRDTKDENTKDDNIKDDNTKDDNTKDDKDNFCPVPTCLKSDPVQCPACGYDLSKHWSKMQLFALGHWLLLCSLFFMLGVVVCVILMNMDILIHEDSYIPRVGTHNEDDPAVFGLFHSIGERIGEVFASIGDTLRCAN